MDRDFEPVVFREAADVEPLVVWWLVTVQTLDVPRVDVHSVQGWLTVVKRALVATVDETGNAGRLSRLVELVGLDEGVAVILTHDGSERPPDVGELQIVGLVQVVFDGLAQLVELLSRWNLWVQARCREIVAGHANASPTWDSVGFVRYGSIAE
ncbi:hypothetical protein [Salinibaculum rarum]|uniref:hypothetical protein n=1 Tax=Salinibaculum rarum TaxID=3058903 RepID=UPI00265E1AE8|nr:hypothetical protein [Salinibaculum sp. KK48]